MSPVHLRKLGISRTQPEDREGLFRTRRPGRGHLGHSGGWQDTEGNHTHSSIHLPIKQKPQKRGLDGYGSSSSAPQTPQRSFPMEHGQQEGQPRIPLGRPWRKLPENMYKRDMLQTSCGSHQRMESHKRVQTLGGERNQDKGESSHYPSYRSTAEPDRAYSDSLRLTRSRPTQLSISSRRQGYQGKKDFFEPKAERFKPNDPENIGLGERSTKETEIAVNSCRISSPNNRNNTPTQNEHHVVTPESNLNGNVLWLQMSQFSEQAQKQFAELQESHVRMEKLTASMDKILKTLQEGLAQLRKSSEETKRRLNQVLEEQNQCKRDSNCLDQD
ncbi:hypothetical protein O181_000702 [Austropuccinia psidii MF-1]|uniref:Uncharacterized protein n=1 Tax=Austropuccinia psidii MF-1 TaxID=1389203 RepID=A0A9Q3B957_9BASI|nr:hypothetical protein [Austropuccinia psidii MF-1]